MTSTTTRQRTTTGRDQVLDGAVDFARAAAEEVAGPGHVGEHLGFALDGDRLGTHYFASAVPGYVGWRWAVSLSRVARARTATVNEVELVAGDDALLAPTWVPWKDRLRPGDLGPGDVLPFVADDARLEQGYEATGVDGDVDRLAIWELGLGRERVLSPAGRAQAMERWYAGDAGPEAPVARSAPGQCSTCGFFMLMAGTPRRIFGVCANEWSPDDGRVVSVDHGCGAHSETRGPEPAELWDTAPPVLDDDIEVLPGVRPPAADAEPADETEAEAEVLAGPVDAGQR